MCKSDSTSAKCPPVVSLSKIAPQPDLDASVFNKKLQFGICIGLNESSILFIRHKMFFQSLKFSSFCQIFPWQIWVRNFYAIPMTGYAMGQSARKENCLLIYQVVLQILMIRNSSWNTSWHNCLIEAFFFCVKDIVIDWESITKPRYSIDLAETNLSGWTVNPRLWRRVTISSIFVSHSTKLLPNVIKLSINLATVTYCNLRQERGSFSNFVNFRGPEQRPFGRPVN